jgi:WD40 repeat protein
MELTSLVAAFCTTGGQYIVRGSEDARIYIWDLQSRRVRVVQTLEGHKGGQCTMYTVLVGLNWHRCHFSCLP